MPTASEVRDLLHTLQALEHLQEPAPSDNGDCTASGTESALASASSTHNRFCARNIWKWVYWGRVRHEGAMNMGAIEMYFASLEEREAGSTVWEPEVPYLGRHIPRSPA